MPQPRRREPALSGPAPLVKLPAILSGQGTGASNAEGSAARPSTRRATYRSPAGEDRGQQ